MEHSAGSDIEGITVGDDLNSLLPLELAQYSDEDMEGLFIYKYRTRRLQTFRYKSETIPQTGLYPCLPQGADDCLSGHLSQYVWHA